MATDCETPVHTFFVEEAQQLNLGKTLHKT